MKFRGRPMGVTCRLFAGLAMIVAVWAGSAGVLSAEPQLPPMAEYRSNLDFSHDYPQDWFRIDRNNTATARTELIFSAADSSSFAGSHTSFLLARIDSLEIKAAFLEDVGNPNSPVIMVNLGPNISRFNREALDLLGIRFKSLLLPPGAVVKTLDPNIARQGLRRRLELTASTTEPGMPERVWYHSYSVKGKGRSFNLTLRGTEADMERLTPVLHAMAASLVDDFNAQIGISSLPRWAEIALIVLFSLTISWLIIRLRDEGRPRSRRKRHRPITFFPLFLIVSAILIVLSYLLTSCQSGRL